MGEGRVRINFFIGFKCFVFLNIWFYGVVELKFNFEMKFVCCEGKCFRLYVFGEFLNLEFLNCRK